MGKKDERLNETRINNDGERMTIVRYGNANDIDIQFVKDGVILEHRQYIAFKKGNVKNPMSPTVCGIGCIGIGKFKPCDENGKPTKCYDTWRHMLMRCYDHKYQKKNPTYNGCRVCKEWWNFQVFAEWYYEHYYELENEIMNLDKDILKKGNKIYSPKTCVFVPSSINTLFTKSNKVRGELPIGVTKHGNKFQVQLTKDNRNIHLGTYTTTEEAFQVYKKAKEAYIKEIAEKYKDKIPYEAYEAILNYEVEITD